MSNVLQQSSSSFDESRNGVIERNYVVLAASPFTEISPGSESQLRQARKVQV